MRDILLCVGALALAAVGVAQAVVGTGWPLLRAAHAAQLAPAAQQAHAAPALRQLVPVDRVERSQLQQVLQRLPDGAVLLDLEALESLDAALDLVQNWRANNPADAPLVCWLGATDSGAELAAAVAALSEQGCTRLNVALPDQPPTLHLAHAR